VQAVVVPTTSTNLDQAVGYLEYKDGLHAVMWDHGQVIDLGSLGGQAEAEGDQRSRTSRGVFILATRSADEEVTV